jgi:F-type H+-transporting ATPase subunit b
MQIDWWTLLLQTINFLVVVWLLSRFLYRPIKRVIEEREAADRKAAEMAEEKVRAADETRREYEAKIAEFAAAQRNEEKRLHAEMERERQAMLEAAEKKGNEVVAEARERVARERKEALEDLGEQIASLATDLARKALGDGVLRGEALCEFVLKYLDDQTEPDVEDLRSDLAKDGGRLSIASAMPLSDAERSRWQEAMTARFKDARIEFETDAALLGGIELRFPHAVLSFSVADRLNRAAKNLKAG